MREESCEAVRAFGSSVTCIASSREQTPISSRVLMQNAEQCLAWKRSEEHEEPQVGVAEAQVLGSVDWAEVQ